MVRTAKDNRKKLIIQADKLWSSFIRNRDGRCVYCGSEFRLNAHHIFTKGRHGNLRWNTDNGVTLCAKCHTFGVHINPAPYMLKIIEYVGRETIEKLRVQAQAKPAPLRIDDLRLIVDGLKVALLGSE